MNLKFNYLFVVALVFNVFFLSCSSDDSNSSSGQGQFFCKIDGTDFNPTFKSGFVEPISGVLLLTGENSNGRGLQLFMPTNIQAGTYVTSDFVSTLQGVQMLYNRVDEDGEFGFAEEGTLTIISHNVSNRTIKGTFSFEGTILNNSTPFNVTEGSFELRYSSL